MIKKKCLHVVFWMQVANIEGFFYKTVPMPGENIESWDPDTRKAGYGKVAVSAIFIDQDDESDSDEFLGFEKENELARQELLRLKKDSALAKFKLDKLSWLNDIAKSLQSRFDNRDKAREYPQIDVDVHKVSSGFKVTLQYCAGSESIMLSSSFENDSISGIIDRIHRDLSLWDQVALITDKENERAEIAYSPETSSKLEGCFRAKRPREDS